MYYEYIFVHFIKFYIFYKLKNIYTNAIYVWIEFLRRVDTLRTCKLTWSLLETVLVGSVEMVVLGAGDAGSGVTVRML